MDFIHGTQVKCDKCDWSKKEKVEDIKNWHNVKCPKCNDCIIVNDNDMVVLNQMIAISKIQTELGIKPDDNRLRKTKIDTAVLR